MDDVDRRSISGRLLLREPPVSTCRTEGIYIQVREAQPELRPLAKPYLTHLQTFLKIIALFVVCRKLHQCLDFIVLKKYI